MRNQLMAGVSRFAHLAGIGRSKANAEGDDKEKDKKEGKASDDKEDEDKERAESDEKDDDKKDAKADDDDDEEDDDDDEKKEKKSKASEDDERCEDDDEEEKEAKAARRGRRMERARWSTVLSSKPAARNIELAVTLLSDTSKSAEHIIGRLSASTGGRSDRQSRNPRIDVAEPNRSSGSQVAASWDRAFKRASGR